METLSVRKQYRFRQASSSERGQMENEGPGNTGGETAGNQKDRLDQPRDAEI